MKTPMVFADKLDSCPKCGCTDLRSYWLNDNGYFLFCEVKCTRCGSSYPARDYYIARLQEDKTKLKVERDK